MSSTRGERIEELFEQGAELTPDQRKAFLDENCRSDPELRAEVETLLRHHDVAKGKFLEGPPAELSDADLRIAGYRIIRRIGEGGMGVVYEAEQLETNHKAAIKILHPHFLNHNIRKRFELEAHLLGRLQHPGIAQIFDSGIARSDGPDQPYFVMELINGTPITDYCVKQTLPINSRLQLFIDVCHAVQHAHQNSIIHRDLKPSNILVTTVDGMHITKVIDFGIAKVVSDPQSGKSTMTEHGQIMGTLAYMSPEQATLGSNDIDTRTDVYSLGVVLYQLLTETPPFEPDELNRVGTDEAHRLIREVDPPTPRSRLKDMEKKSGALPRQRALEIRSLSKRLRGDLECIVMKALEKDRARRYETASELAQDIKRYLNNDPVFATPPSVIYRTGKFVRKYKLLVTASVAVLMAIVVGIIGTTTMFFRAERARAEALIKAQTSTQVTDLLVALFEAPDPQKATGRLVSAREILETAKDKLPKLEGQPLVQATLLDAVGRSYLGLGLFEEAKEPLEKSLELRRRYLGDQHIEVAASMEHNGQLLKERGKLDAAHELLVNAFAIRKQLNDPNGSAEAKYWLGEVQLARENWDDAMRWYKEAESDFRTIDGSRIWVGRSVHGQASAAYRRYQIEEAKSLFEKACPLLLPKVDESPLDYSLCMANWGMSLTYSSDLPAEAQRLIENGLQTVKKIFGDDHPQTAALLDGIALVYWINGQRSLALPLAEEGLRIRRDRLGDSHSLTIESLNNVATYLGLLGKSAEAEPLLRELLLQYRQRLGDADGWTRLVKYNLAQALYAQGKDLNEVADLLEQAYLARPDRTDDHNPEVTKELRELIEVLGRAQQWGRAEPYSRELVRRARLETSGESSSRMMLANALLLLGQDLIGIGDPDGAEPFLREAVEIVQEVKGKYAFEPGWALTNLGKCLTLAKRFGDAERALLASYDAFSSANLSAEEALKRLVELYAAWLEAEPNNERTHKALEEWQARLQLLSGEEK